VQDSTANWQQTPSSSIHEQTESIQTNTTIETVEANPTPTLISPQPSVPDVAAPLAETTEQQIGTIASDEETIPSPSTNDTLPSIAPQPEIATATEAPSAITDVNLATASLGEVVDSTTDPIEASSEDVDALTVKVVDDIPIVEASSAVASSETQLQPSSLGGAGPGDISAIAQSAPDLAQLSPSQPTPFYKVVCPKCGADVPQPTKVWELKGGKSKKNVLIGLFQCQDCRVKFREALSREII